MKNEQPQNPFAVNVRYGQLRCPSCWRVFEGWKRSLAVVLHYVQECRGSLVDSAIESYVLFVLGRIELRMNQRDLVHFAATAGFFSVRNGSDSKSLHSLRRLGIVSISGRPDAPMAERYWHITRLGSLVDQAQRERESELEARERISRTRQRAAGASRDPKTERGGMR